VVNGGQATYVLSGSMTGPNHVGHAQAELVRRPPGQPDAPVSPNYISEPLPPGDIPGRGDQFGTGAFDNAGTLQPGEYVLLTFCIAGSVADATQGGGSTASSFDFTLTFTP
jgi:hypothetical protein